jgi:eukaryotic-like serine/threonine-protein kinase
MTLAAGTRLGPYEILAPLGAGGMGEVYRAKDTRVDRPVALKVLPEEFFEDEDRRARFEREARTLASLNHPRIAVLYSFEEIAGSSSSGAAGATRHLLVMELVEGDGLDQKIASGPLPVEESLSYAKQIAEALEAAHEKGIVHRDLKPANIKVTPDGKVKLLDFGLAKIFEGDGTTGSAPSVTHSPTLTARATAAGMILGTAAYMSPEQARGKTLDKRTDIWAFGCVLFEMLTGKRAFEGETVSDTLAAVLRGEPDWSALRAPGISSKVVELLRRCLQREAKQRLRDIGDARIALEEEQSAVHAAAQGTSSNTGGAQSAAGAGASSSFTFEATPGGAFSGSKRTLVSLVPWFLAAAFAAAALFLGAVLLRRPSAPMRVIQTSLLPPEGWSFDYLSGPMVLSPTGSRIAFAVTNPEGQGLLCVRALDSPEVQLLRGTEAARNPFWSPDGRSIGFMSPNAGLAVIPASGGAVESVAQSGPGRGATWNQGGVILFSPSLLSPIYRISLADRRRVAVTTLDEARGESVHQWPHFLPDGRHFLFVVQRVDPVSRRSESEVYVQELGSNEKKLLVRAGSRAIYAPPGYLLYVWNGNLMAQALDLGSLSLTGDAFVVAPHAQFLADGSTGIFSASSDELLVYAEGGTIGLAQLNVFDRAGSLVRALGSPGNTWTPRLSPDGRRVAVESIDPVSGNRDIWTQDTAGVEPPTRMTFDPGEDYTPVFSPDGTRVAFGSFRKGAWSIIQKRLTGSEDEEVLASAFAVPGSKFLTDWSRDGKLIAFTGWTRETSDDMWLLSVAERKDRPLLVTPSSERDTVFSPDGRWIAYMSSESSRSEVYVKAFPGPGGKWQVSTAGGLQPRWRRDGQELFYQTLGGRLMAVPVKAGASFEKGSPRELFGANARRTNIAQYDVFPDGKTFIVNSVVAGKASLPLTLVQNWAARAKK